MTPPSDHSTIAQRLPDGLEPLDRLARNLAWTWDEQIAAVLREVDPEGLVAASGNPVAMLAAVSPARLDALAGDAGFRERLVRAEARLDEHLAAPSWYATLPDAPGAIAYFSPEFGLSEALPQYSGGLGILAGDHLKAASDLGVPIVGIGLFYRNGYFRQVLTAGGAQQEEFVELDPALLPMTPVRGADGAPVVISLPLPGATLHAALWRVDVGRVPLLLLDTDVEDNEPAERAVTDRLYGGDSEHRLRQEILLGIGGVKALAACGIEPAVFHMNEGHAGFLALERVRGLVEEGTDPEHALQIVRARTVFTTHTPVPAGIDRFSHDLMARYFGPGGVPTGLPLERLLALGAEAGGDPGVFNMAALGIRMAARVNGVSRLHASVARAMFAPLFPGVAVDDVPITHVTNGVHAETWVGPEFGALYRGRLGDRYGTRADGWEHLASVSDDELFEARADARLRLVDEVRRRLARQARERGDDPADSAWLAGVLDPQALTLGFARRVPDLQAADAAAARARAAHAHPDERRSARAAARGRQGAPARRRRQAPDRGVRGIRGGPRRPPPRDHAGRLRHGARRRTRLGRGRVAQHAAATARGLRHERHEGGAQRRAQPLDPRRLVGRVLRAGVRLGDPLGRGARQRSRSP